MGDKDCCCRDGRIAMCTCEDRKECKFYEPKTRKEDCLYHRPDIINKVCDKPRA